MRPQRARPLVSVIIPTRNRTDKLARCLDSVYTSDYGELEVVVVDDASLDPVADALSGRFPKTRFIRNQERMLLSCSRNAGAGASSGEYLFFLDDDNIVASDAIRLLADTLDGSDRVAVSSPIIFYLAQPDTVWTSYISKSKFAGFYTLHTEIPSREAPTFAFHNSFMVKRAIFERLRGFDCANLPIRLGEIDFAHRIREAGYVAVVNPGARDWHDLGWAMVHIDSDRAFYTERNRIIILKRYYSARDLKFYEICVLPFLGLYYLVHHSLSTSDGAMKTAGSLMRGIVDGLRFQARATSPDEKVF
jgi:GT2 family glycosyltransferase